MRASNASTSGDHDLTRHAQRCSTMTGSVKAKVARRAASALSHQALGTSSVFLARRFMVAPDARASTVLVQVQWPEGVAIPNVVD